VDNAMTTIDVVTVRLERATTRCARRATPTSRGDADADGTFITAAGFVPSASRAAAPRVHVSIFAVVTIALLVSWL